jgi:hypothetical protein
MTGGKRHASHLSYPSSFTANIFLQKYCHRGFVFWGQGEVDGSLLGTPEKQTCLELDYSGVLCFLSGNPFY